MSNGKSPDRPVPATAAPGFGMTDLEEALRAPGGTQLGANLVARLDALLAQADAEAKAGLQPEQFARTVTARNALAAARDIVLKFPKG